MQYQSECLSALKSVVNIHKPFEKTFMDTMKLFMAIPDRINFLQLGRYGCFSEQTYRNLFENETFDWFAFNASIISKHLTGKRKAIAIDPSYIPKSGHKTPWIGYFWSGCAGDYKRGLEIMGIGVIDIDNHECMTLGSIHSCPTCPVSCPVCCSLCICLRLSCPHAPSISLPISRRTVTVSPFLSSFFWNACTAPSSGCL